MSKSDICSYPRLGTWSFHLKSNSLKVLLRSKFNSFQLIRSGCTCFGHWNELWRPLSENIELENVGFSRPPLQIYVPVTKLLFSDCDVIVWTRQENKPELENVGFSRPPLQIYVPVTKLLFSDCDVIVWTRQEKKPEPWENCERLTKLRSSSSDFGIVKEEIVDSDDSVEPAPTEYEKVKY